ncbi:vascular endothelial growth factor receptor 1-like [Bacillus rossius redtenbacheri]|uniref:vascular endothelial growth factor receptor 1-like n=1 Tax=Bacillus rossius redtenbacheri TaxID=93214 RepID=UPI002FDDCD8D
MARAAALLACLAAVSGHLAVPKPSMTSSKVHVEVGNNVSYTCNVTTQLNQTFNWRFDYPAKSANKSDHVVCHMQTDPNYIDKRGIMTCDLINVTHFDQGNYTCIYVDLSTGRTESESHFMQVYDKGTYYVRLHPENEERHITVSSEEDKEAIFTIDIISNPKVTSVKWLRGKTDLSESKSRISINNTYSNTMITINNLSVWDTGNYTVQVENGRTNNSYTFFFEVVGKPQVTVQAKGSYLYNHTKEINCSVIGNPKSTIKWFGHFCGLQLECNHAQVTEYNKSSYFVSEAVDGEFEQISTLRLTALQSGRLTCSAVNDEGTEKGTGDFIITDTPYSDDIWLNVQGVTHNASHQPVEADDVVLTCGIPVTNSKNDLLWYKGRDIVRNTSEHKTSYANTKYSYRTSIKFESIAKKHEGNYSCKWTTLDGHTRVSSLQLKIIALQRPFFVETNMNQTEWKISQGKMVNWTCRISGSPKPNILWYKNNKFLEINMNDTKRINLHKDNFSLTINYAVESDEGEYKCEGSNKDAKLKRVVTLTIKDKKNSIGLIVGIVILTIILLGFLILLIYKIREAQKIRRDLELTGLSHFKEGAMENFNPDLPIDEQADLLPYDKRWEFPRDRLKMGRQLGAGAFGVVRKAEAWGIVEGESVTTVAVKMVKSADIAYIKALASELKIMLHLGKHLNVVNLLGACTEELNKKEFLVIVEFCRYGNLQNFLMRHRALFIDQLDPETGEIDFEKGQELLRVKSTNSTRSRFRYPGWKLPRGDSSQSMKEGEKEQQSSGQMSPTVNSDMSVCMSPGGNEDCPVLSNNSVQPGWRSNFVGDYRSGHVEPIFTRDLLCWAFQVARGMEYLAGKKVMHGDLASRNILLADDNVVKICDFGLAKSMYKSDNYKKKGEGPLPMKWMAIESLRDRVFSTQSDVWSYGVVLWEIFSLARTPYPGMEADERLFNSLISGYRMECPEYSTREIYQLMLNCWDAEPTRRPTFTKLVEEFGAMLENSVREHYVDLNDPYIAMNKQTFQDCNDYLNMVTAPTYENLMSPSYKNLDHHYINNPDAVKQLCLDAAAGSGYIKMNRSSQPDDLMIFSPSNASVARSGVFTFETSPAQKQLGNSANSEVQPLNGNDTDEIKTTNGDLKQSTDGVQLQSVTTKETPSFCNPNYMSCAHPLISKAIE